MQQAIQMRQKVRMNDKNVQLQHAAALASSLDPYRVLARGCVRSRQYQARCRVETVEEINESTQKL